MGNTRIHRLSVVKLRGDVGKQKEKRSRTQGLGRMSGLKNDRLYGVL